MIYHFFFSDQGVIDLIYPFANSPRSTIWDNQLQATFFKLSGMNMYLNYMLNCQVKNG